ncbi:YEATS-associated helix-containing protein [Sediminibacterium goheungense]|uniref:YEATS-Like-Associating Three TM domain-containing protein n=1 Tax=Sediminibacterium goheungense TaxID=1086393 RepID=A0A4R6ITA6_9BACT|nr:YEATS-associated helix-containing protein [Sediminibacterium goheungense]TDO25754.1 hypothetical protein BC659_2677 [Sediminibacterium goheungense]
MSHTSIIILIIFLSGILGGLTNFFLAYDLQFSRKECLIFFFKTLLLSLCASITVPLFLQIISNNLLDAQPNTPYPLKSYLILAGFCILAAFYSKRFLEDLYDRVKRVEAKAEKAEKTVEMLEASSQETENISNLLTDEVQLRNSENIPYNNDQAFDVITAIYESKFTWRTVSGIAKDTKSKLSENQVLEILKFLKKENIVTSRISKNGTEVWRIVDL